MRKTKYLLGLAAVLAMLSCGSNSPKPAEEEVEVDTMEVDSAEQAKQKRYEAVQKKVQSSKKKSGDPDWNEGEKYSFNHPLDE